MPSRALLLALCTPAALSQSLPPWPGSIFLSYGYNILTGNPTTAGADPGWSTQPIYDINCASCFAGGAQFESYSLPDGVFASDATFCSYNASTWTVHDAASSVQVASSSMTCDVNLNLILADVAFSASDFTSTVTTSTADGGATLMISTGECDLNTVSIDLNSFSFALSDNFLAGLASLPPLSPTSTDAYLDFISTFGTHVPEALTLGATAVQVNTFASADFNAVQSAVGSVTDLSSASLLIFFGLEVAGGESWSYADYLTFAGATSSNGTTCKPACPPSSPTVGVDPLQWRQYLNWSPSAPGQSTPTPVRATLTPLPVVLLNSALPAAFKSGRINELELTALTAVSNDLLTYLNSSYCSAVPGCGTPSSVPVEVHAPLASTPTATNGAIVAYMTSTGGDDAILLIGGSTSCAATPPTPTNAVSVANAADLNSGWIVKPPAPLPISHAASIPFLDSNASALFITGGWVTPAGSATPVVSNASWSYSLSDGSWSPQASLATPRAAPIAVYFNHMTVVAGGFDGTSTLSSVECIPAPCVGIPATLPLPLAASAAVVVPSPATPSAQRLIIAGGCTSPDLFNLACSAPSASVWFMDSTGPGAGNWTALPALPSPVYAHSMLWQAPNAAAGIPDGAVWVLSGGGTVALPAPGVFRLLMHSSVWQTLPWPDAWPAAFGATLSLPANEETGQPDQTWRVGGCMAASASTTAASDMIVAFQGGLYTAVGV